MGVSLQSSSSHTRARLILQKWARLRNFGADRHDNIIWRHHASPSVPLDTVFAIWHVMMSLSSNAFACTCTVLQASGIYVWNKALYCVVGNSKRQRGLHSRCSTGAMAEATAASGPSVEKASEMTLFAQDGTAVPFADLYKEKKAVVVFVRHFL